MVHRYIVHMLLSILFTAMQQEAAAFTPNSQRMTVVVGKLNSCLLTKREGSQSKCGTKLYQSSNGGDKNPPLTAFLEKASNTGIDNKSIKLNSLVVTKYDLPELGIFADQTYELKSIYLQGSNKESGEIEKIPLPVFDLTGTAVPPGYTLYIALYSPMYHDGKKHRGQPVIVTPEEVGLVSMKDEVLDSVLVAIPILSFWLGTIFVFVTKYNERYGGNFFDALFGK